MDDTAYEAERLPMNYLLNGGVRAAAVFTAILYGPKLLGFIVLAVLVYFGGWKQL